MAKKQVPESDGVTLLKAFFALTHFKANDSVWDSETQLYKSDEFYFE